MEKNILKRFINRVTNFLIKPQKDKIDIDELPKGRSSIPNFEGTLESLKTSLEFLTPNTYKQYIPLIRKLLAINSSLSLAVVDNVQLCNPGFKLIFPEKVPNDEATEIRKHIKRVSKNWGFGTGGLNGLINKMLFQIFISGALSNEWVIKKDLSGIDFIAFVNPEDVEFAYDHKTGRYRYFQKVNQKFFNNKPIKGTGLFDLVPLSDFTYRFFEMINDQEFPVVIPPFLSVLPDLASQRKMLDNINFITDQFGLMGFLELLMQKPSRKEGENDSVYKHRLEQHLKSAKESTITGLKDGVVVGYKDDHEFNFHSISKDLNGLPDIFEINHRMVSNGMFTSPSFQGGNIGGSETHINIIFTKMLSQLNNMQSIIKENIEYGLWLELTLANFKHNKVEIQFNKSTLTDELKHQQADEVKIRNNRVLYSDGIIDLTQYAYNMGYEETDLKEPRIPIDPNGVLKQEEDRKEREKDKDASDRKVREKNKPQPKNK